MGCFPCFPIKKTKSKKEHVPIVQAKDNTPSPHHVNGQLGSTHEKAESSTTGNGANSAKTFTFRELATATKNFRQECLLGEGAFGRVFKAILPPSGQVVAVRQLDRNGTLGSKEFMVEVLTLSLLRHPNLVSLIGYCADGDQRLLVYEYMTSGSLQDYLFEISADMKPLDWSARMKIASGVAEGLEYLHEKANPPIIYRDLKSSNIMLDEQCVPKLSEYGLAKLLQNGNKMHISPRVVAAYGYCAPEYERQGELTVKSDVYSFGVVLLELITGRRAVDTSKPAQEQGLVHWAQPFFRDPKRFPEMADPLLNGEFPVTSLNQAVGVAAMCLQEEPAVRPLISDVMAALTFLAMAPPEAPIPSRLVPILSSKVGTSSRAGEETDITDEDISDGDDDDGNKHPPLHKYDEQEDKGSSFFEFVGSPVNSEHDDKYTEGKSRGRTNASKKLGSSSKGRSKARSEYISSRSRDDSLDLSLRSGSHFQEGSNRFHSRNENYEEFDNYASGSGSEVEYWEDSLGSSSAHRYNDRSVSANSRSNRKMALQTASIRSKKKQQISTRSDNWRSTVQSNMEEK